MYRAGYPKPTFERFRGCFSPKKIAELQQYVLQTPLIPISSTEIRRRLAESVTVGDLLPDSVIGYIQEHRLYGYTH